MEQKFSEETERVDQGRMESAAERQDGPEPAAEPMAQTDPIAFQVKLHAKDLWKFSMYHSNKGLLGLFNVIFSVAAVFLLITTWKEDTPMYRALLLVCALLFTVWQPFTLYLKAARQAKNPSIQNPMNLSFSREGIVVSQNGESLELLWENIGRVEKVWDMVIVYMDKVHAYLLPDRITGEKKEALCALFHENMAPERRKRI